MFQYIIVLDRKPFKDTFCACCGERLVEGYLREFPTGLYYCPVFCHQWSEKIACIAIEDHARRVS